MPIREMPRRSPLALLILFAAGCRPAEAQLLEPNYTAADVQSKAPASPPPAAPTARAKSDQPPSWTDERVIAALEKNCAFDPDRLSSDERTAWFAFGEQNPMSCQGEFDQSCVYDPCFISEQRSCKPRCVKQCQTCSAGCVSACEACKQACKKGPDEPACRQSCASTCGACRQGCVRTRDRCSTGTCSNEYRACRGKLKADWVKNGCPEVCRSYGACQAPCLRKHEKKGDGWEACTKPCYPPKDQRKGCDMLLCPGEFGMGIDPTDWHR